MHLVANYLLHCCDRYVADWILEKTEAYTGEDKQEHLFRCLSYLGSDVTCHFQQDCDYDCSFR